MDDAEVVKASAEGVTTAFVKPFGDLLTALLGPAAEELGLAFRDHVRFFRWERYQRFVAKAEEIFERTGKKPKPIPLKILLPILENGSIEDDDNLQDRWAALLVSLSGDKRNLVSGAVAILKQLNSYEVLLLQMCFDYVSIDVTTPEADLNEKPLNETYHQWFAVLREKYSFGMPGLEDHRYAGIMVENLKRHRLLEGERNLYMTSMGYEFVTLCQDWSERAKAKSGAA